MGRPSHRHRRRRRPKWRTRRLRPRPACRLFRGLSQRLIVAPGRPELRPPSVRLRVRVGPNPNPNQLCFLHGSTCRVRVWIVGRGARAQREGRGATHPTIGAGDGSL
eukprot:scaffold105084_cov43-Phaeocystis_antarctica.AAC.2